MSVQFAHVVSFRLTEEQALMAERLREAFPEGTWAEMGRWLFSDRIIRSKMLEQIQFAGVEEEWTFEPDEPATL